MASDTDGHANHPGELLTLPRRWLVLSLSMGVLSCNAVRSRDAHAETQDIIRQPATVSDTAFIERAFEMRTLAVQRGDQAYGAVVVRGGKIIGQSSSRVLLDQDPTAHAEMSAIRDAARRAQNRDLSGATLYSSSRPCPMCEAAAYWSGISEMVHGKDVTNAGSPKLCRS